MKLPELLPDTRAILLLCADRISRALIAEGKRSMADVVEVPFGSAVYLLEPVSVLVGKVEAERQELIQAMAGTDRLEVLDEASDVLYQAVKLSAHNRKLDPEGADYDELVLVSLAASLASWGWDGNDIQVAAIEKMALRSQGIKDHARERAAIAAALAPRDGAS